MPMPAPLNAAFADLAAGRFAVARAVTDEALTSLVEREAVDVVLERELDQRLGGEADRTHVEHAVDARDRAAERRDTLIVEELGVLVVAHDELDRLLPAGRGERDDGRAHLGFGRRGDCARGRRRAAPRGDVRRARERIP